jgi:hypothetical protein
MGEQEWRAENDLVISTEGTTENLVLTTRQGGDGGGPGKIENY